MKSLEPKFGMLCNKKVLIWCKNVLLTIPVIWACHQPFALLLWLGRMTFAKSSFNKIFATLWYIRDTRLHIIWCIEALEEICKYRILCRSRYYELRKCEKQKKSDCIPPRNLKLWHFEKFCHMRNLPYCYISAEGSSWVPSFSSQAAVDSTNNRHLLLLVDSTMVTLDKLGPKRTTTESSAFCIESYKVVKTTFLLLSQFAY